MNQTTREVTITCLRGYRFRDGQRSKIYPCDSDGGWRSIQSGCTGMSHCLHPRTLSLSIKNLKIVFRRRNIQRQSNKLLYVSKKKNSDQHQCAPLLIIIIIITLLLLFPVNQSTEKVFLIWRCSRTKACGTGVGDVELYEMLIHSALPKAE